MSKQFNQFDPSRKWEYENGYHFTSHISRIPKMLAHYELYKSITHLPGEVLECGVFKGASLIRFLTFRQVLESPYSRKVIGFDMFGKFPVHDAGADKEFIDRFEADSGDGFSVHELKEILEYKGFENYELIEGDVLKTVPDYVDLHPELRIAFLHIDVDVYKPTQVILNSLFERVVKGGVIVLDDYGKVAGETSAVDQFLADKNHVVEKLAISHIPAYIRK